MTQSSTITRVEARAVEVPLSKQVRWATRAVKSREYLLISIHDTADRVGHGFAYVGAGGAVLARSFVDTILGPIVTGLPADRPSRMWERAYQESTLLGRRGLALRAMSAVDIALWDLLGKIANLPLARLLGGYRDSVPAYGSGGYYLGGDPIEDLEQQLATYVNMGFRDFKIKVGGLDPRTDAARVMHARAYLGEGARLALDANNAWHSTAEALAFLDSVRDTNVWWIEEPFAPDNLQAHADLARRIAVPVATGEIHATRWEFAEIVRLGAAAILQADATVVGGVSEWIRIAGLAEATNLSLAPHWAQDVHVHLVGATGAGLAVEYFHPDGGVMNFDTLLVDPLQPEAGILRVPERPGLGVEFDRAAVREWEL